MGTDAPGDDYVELPIEEEIDLHAFTARDVKRVVEEYLYQCHLKGFRQVRIIHGKGIGTQKGIVRGILEKSPYVRSVSEPPADLGGWGATLVNLKGPEGS
jgi:DNA-nicking Smr family endonuclease